MAKVIEWDVRAMSHDGIYEVSFTVPSEHTNAKDVRKVINSQKGMYDISRVLSVKKSYFQPEDIE